ncbi:kynurenine formamidase [Platysternon megacephalum]|uniref:Kynurenine formamidase n=1 Tax=Platysternon megacephalum TaxID=55544 RepID=A0A4D9E9D7_9SAUR|nr:kynurenine formamidase [Platysternon megacephalum]
MGQSERRIQQNRGREPGRETRETSWTPPPGMCCAAKIEGEALELLPNRPSSSELKLTQRRGASTTLPSPPSAWDVPGALSVRLTLCLGVNSTLRSPPPPLQGLPALGVMEKGFAVCCGAC